MPNRSRLQLPFAQWPNRDQRAWTLATTQVDRFDEPGRGAHLADTTKRVLKISYSEYLKFLLERRQGLLKKPLGSRISPSLIAPFVKWLAHSRGDRRIAVSLHHLRLAMRLVDPNLDLRWLLIITKRLAKCAPPSKAKPGAITSEHLYQLGMTLMDQAEAESSRDKSATGKLAILYRDGLIIALMAEIPLRRRTLTALRTHDNLVKEDECWLLDIAGDDTKMGQPLEFLLSHKLSGRIDRYLERYRPRIPGAPNHNGLWASEKGGCLSSNGLYDIVCKRTEQNLGVRTNPHAFRHAAGSLWSRQDPRNILGIKDLLGQTSFGTAQRYYIGTRSRLAGRILANIVDAKRMCIHSSSVEG
jgi:integrase/recombinase XerD